METWSPGDRQASGHHNITYLLEVGKHLKVSALQSACKKLNFANPRGPCTHIVSYSIYLGLHAIPIQLL